MSSLTEQAKNLLNLIPETGAIGNVTLRKKLVVKDNDDPLSELATEKLNEYFAVAKSELLAAGLIKLGRGKGGSVRRTEKWAESWKESDLVSPSPFIEQVGCNICGKAWDSKVVSETLTSTGKKLTLHEDGSLSYPLTNSLTTADSTISYPTGSLGEHVPDATGDSSEIEEEF